MNHQTGIDAGIAVCRKLCSRLCPLTDTRVYAPLAEIPVRDLGQLLATVNLSGGLFFQVTSAFSNHRFDPEQNRDLCRCSPSTYDCLDVRFHHIWDTKTTFHINWNTVAKKGVLLTSSSLRFGAQKITLGAISAQGEGAVVPTNSPACWKVRGSAQKIGGWEAKARGTRFWSRRAESQQEPLRGSQGWDLLRGLSSGADCRAAPPAGPAGRPGGSKGAGEAPLV